MDDLIDAILAMMESDATITGPINLGNPDEFTILELAEKTIAMTGSTSRIVRRPLPLDDPRQRRPDITRARCLLGWEPRTGLTEGLERTIAYFRTRLAELGPVGLRDGLGGAHASRAGLAQQRVLAED